MTRTPVAVTLSTALAKIVIGQGIVPFETLSLPIAVGDTAATFVSGATLRTDAVVQFWDDTRELGAPIDTITLNADGTRTVTFRFTGQGPGFQFAHLTTCMVTTNIFRHPLDSNAAAFGNGFPVVGCYVLDNTIFPASNGEYKNMAMLTMHYQQPALQADLQRMDPQLLTAKRLDQGEYDIDKVVEYLEAWYRLEVNGAANAVQVLKFIESRRKNITDPTTPVFESFVDIQVQAKPDNINTARAERLALYGR